ncbi:MAG TPA: hypothetical protein VMV77_04535 [Bacteroidales bacterium]|nr:hypothetical protein [Bacteroidales bacterium]
MELSILSTGISEPVNIAEVRDFIGYPSTNQDTVIKKMIITAREWLEEYCAISIVNKQYKAYFEKADALNGWYELPVSPVLSTPALVVAVRGVTIDFEQMGLNIVRVRPYSTYGTIGVGSTGVNWYMEVTFNAGAANNTADEIIRKIVATMFNARTDGAGEGVQMGRLPYDTLRLISAINKNTGL